MDFKEITDRRGKTAYYIDGRRTTEKKFYLKKSLCELKKMKISTVIGQYADKKHYRFFSYS